MLGAQIEQAGGIQSTWYNVFLDTNHAPTLTHKYSIDIEIKYVLIYRHLKMGVIPGFSEDRGLIILKCVDQRYETLIYEELKTQEYHNN